ncbi:hypothetical protein MferCBS31731_006659 [Microsporum ferrugineum]
MEPDMKSVSRASSRTRKPTLKAKEAELNKVTKPMTKAKPRKRAIKKDTPASMGSIKQSPKLEPQPEPKTEPKTDTSKLEDPKLESPELVKPDNGKETIAPPALPTIPTITITDETGKTTEVPQTPPRLSKEDEMAVTILLEMAAAALAPDFTPEVEVDLVDHSRQFYSQFPTTVEAETMGRLADSSELAHPDLRRPYTDKGGWTHTGRVNQHGEEYIIMPPSFTRWSPAETVDPSAATDAPVLQPSEA